MRLEIVICTYTEHRSHLLEACVASAIKELPEAGRITIVVDHAVAHAQALGKRYRHTPQVRLMENTRQRGLSGARNTAIAASTAEVLLFVDDDAILQEGWFEALASRFEDPNAAIIAGAVLPDWESATGAPRWFPPEFGWVVGCDYTGMAASGSEVRNPIGACMAIRREVFAGIGLFAEGLGRIGSHPVGGEETDLGIRLRRQMPDARIIRDAGITVSHFVPQARARVSYMLRRCFWEGRSKALLQARDSGPRSLGAERTHVLTTVRRAVLADVRSMVGGDRSAFPRNLVRLAAVCAAGAGFATSRRQHRRQALLEGSPHLGVDVTVCIATLGRSRALAETVRAILTHTLAAVEVLVVDNDPRSGRVHSALEGLHDPRLRIVTEPRKGLSLARNRGISAARGRVVAFTDDDAHPQPGWIDALLSAFSDPVVGGVTGRVIPMSTATDEERWFEEAIGFDKGETRNEWGRGNIAASGWQRGRRGPVYPIAAGEFGSGNNMAFPRAFLVEQHGFAETLGAGSLTRGGEDLDVFRRVILAGRVLRYEPAALVKHQHRDTLPALRTQLFGYGTGMAANVTRLAATSPRHIVAVLRSLPAGLRMLLAKDSAKNSQRPGDYPHALVWIERLGYVAGPVLYLLEAVRTGLG
ncbi:glycosyl transferase, family 2 [Leucobacter sp. 7(1)]|uniref:glycosyltransferase n=1 Tax=Leucobacter sp. 7(1) TaxID=1255613 RepID=UPI00097F2295|nr:glycosyltransferase [Leucobacter sp. 7(1)]SJN10408.1 glycosyl transferase, family 2 [Leucobacter sp. 7(1)]